MVNTKLIITPEQLHAAASALAGTIEGLDTVEQAQARLWTWLQDAVGALIDDAAVYAISQRGGFLTRAFLDVR